MSDTCLNCEERESNEQGVLCDECRAEMWGDERTHHGSIDDRTGEDMARANGQM